MKAFWIASSVLIAATVALAADAPAPPKVGDPAPDFSLPYATQDSIASDDLKLSAIEGKRNIILAFYPADWSGGCTKEVCSLRDNFTALSSMNADVLGISGDSPFSHYEWAKFHKLPFRLLSDHKHEVAPKYASYDPGSGFNKRTVYAIDKSGKIAYIDLHYSPRDEASLNKLRDALSKKQ